MNFLFKFFDNYVVAPDQTRAIDYLKQALVDNNETLQDWLYLELPDIYLDDTRFLPYDFCNYVDPHEIIDFQWWDLPSSFLEQIGFKYENEEVSEPLYITLSAEAWWWSKMLPEGFVKVRDY